MCACVECIARMNEKMHCISWVNCERLCEVMVVKIARGLSGNVTQKDGKEWVRLWAPIQRPIDRVEKKVLVTNAAKQEFPLDFPLLCALLWLLPLYCGHSHPKGECEGGAVVGMEIKATEGLWR